MKQSTLITSLTIANLTLPLYQPFRTAKGQHDALENLLVTITLTDGTRGFGEAAIAPHITGETVEKTTKNLHAARRLLIGRDAAGYENLSRELHRQFPHNNATIAAIEMATLDALTRQRRIPLWKLFSRRAVGLRTDITVVIAAHDATTAFVRKWYRRGFRAFKVKVGRDRAHDFERVRIVRACAPRCMIYLDANQGYTASETLAFLERLAQAGIRPALLEQPVPREDWQGLKDVSRRAARMGIPVCADESVASLAHARRAIRERAVPVINIKLMKCGLVDAIRIAREASRAGVKLMMGGMMESSLAMTAAAHLAAGLGCFSYIDLDTPFFLRRDIVRRNPYLSRTGVYDVRRVKAGIGITPK